MWLLDIVLGSAMTWPLLVRAKAVVVETKGRSWLQWLRCESEMRKWRELEGRNCRNCFICQERSADHYLSSFFFIESLTGVRVGFFIVYQVLVTSVFLMLWWWSQTWPPGVDLILCACSVLTLNKKPLVFRSFLLCQTKSGYYESCLALWRNLFYI